MLTVIKDENYNIDYKSKSSFKVTKGPSFVKVKIQLVVVQYVRSVNQTFEEIILVFKMTNQDILLDLLWSYLEPTMEYNISFLSLQSEGFLDWFQCLLPPKDVS